MGTFFFYLFIVLFIVVCLFMILLILIQKGRGGGLSSAFGGAGGNTAFGSKTGDVLTWATSVVFGIFLVLAIILNLMSNTRQATAQENAGLGQLPPAGAADDADPLAPSGEPSPLTTPPVENPPPPPGPEGAVAPFETPAAPTTQP